MTISRDLTVQRVRHPLKMRLLQVLRTQLLSPQLLRVTLGGEDLADFTSGSFDDHIKVFFPAPGAERPVLPVVGPDGIVFPEGQPRPQARDYTPRRFDPVARELDIEFVLHGDGPASTWAAQARPGQYLGVGGPRGSFVIPTEFDWHLLIGDDTALPAIARRVEELGPDARVIVVAEVTSATAQIPLAVGRARRCTGSIGKTSPKAACSRRRCGRWTCRLAKAMSGRPARAPRCAPCASTWWANAAWTRPASAHRPTGSAATRRCTRPSTIRMAGFGRAARPRLHWRHANRPDVPCR